jgi:hypothetical protein
VSSGGQVEVWPSPQAKVAKPRLMERPGSVKTTEKLIAVSICATPSSGIMLKEPNTGGGGMGVGVLVGGGGVLVGGTGVSVGVGGTGVSVGVGGGVSVGVDPTGVGVYVLVGNVDCRAKSASDTDINAGSSAAPSATPMITTNSLFSFIFTSLASIISATSDNSV